MFRTIHPSWRAAVATAVFTMAIGVAGVPIARAVGPVTWWVAPTGTAASPADTGSSCNDPSYVGNTAATIQAAITGATAGDEIKICEGTYAISTTLTVDKALTLTGVGSRLPVLDGQSSTRIMNITTGASTVNIDALHFRNGLAIIGGANQGGAIYAHPDVALSISSSLFVNNRASEHGGAIAQIGLDGGVSSGSVQITDSTFHKNSGLDGGGVVVVGLVNNPSTISNSTFVANSASRGGGAINGSFSVLRAHNSTFIDNIDSEGGGAVWAASLNKSLIAYTPSLTPNNTACKSVTASNNVSTDSSCLGGGAAVTAESLNLGFLAPWGGPVPTFSIGSGSSAIGAVTSGCPSNDQRGFSRSGSPCDAGAFEFQPSAPSITPSSVSPIDIVQGMTITGAPTFTHSGFNGTPTFRVASELDGPLPGVNLSSTGQLSGTPGRTVTAKSLVITASDSNGAVASAILPIGNCVLSQSNGEYTISNPVELEIFGSGACGLASSYRQTTNIAWSGLWDSAATSATPFTGAYDGGGYSITGLRIANMKAAFLSYTSGASISALNFSADVFGGYGSAGLVGYADSTVIEGVHGTGTISTVGGCHGGLVGEADASTISDSSFEGTIDAPDSSWNGGLVGCPWGSSSIERSYFDGTVNGWDDIGGLVGWFGEVGVRNSYAIGSISASGSGVGGLLGGDDDPPYTGLAVIENSFVGMSIQSTGGAPIIGALIGEGPSTAITSSFWEAGLTGVDDLDPIGFLRDQGGTQPALSATSASSMTSFSFFDDAGWAIVDGWSDPSTSQDVWGICDGEGRPFLLWQYSTDPCVVAQQPSPQPNNPPAPTPTPVAPPAASTPPSTSTPIANPTAPIMPSVPVGGMVTMVGGREVPSSIAWSGGSTLTGRIGNVDLSIAFPTSSMGSAASLAPGSSMNLTIGGLAPGSSASATIFSTPTSLGEFTVDANGRLSTGITVPRGLAAGSHRLRLAMTAANGDDITFWVGVTVPPSVLQLPTTGSSDVAMAVTATWLLAIGIGLTATARRRPTLRGSIHPTK